MEATVENRRGWFASTPWHLFAVGGLGLLWAYLCFAYFGVTGSANPSVGGWTATFLAASIWGGLGGSALLLARSCWAVQAFTTALVGVMATSASLFVFADQPANLYAMPMMFGLWVITLATLFYASRVKELGFLR